MADFVNREVARANLRKACKSGVIVSVLLMLAGLCYAGVAGLIAANAEVPAFVSTAISAVVPMLGDTALAVADCGTRAALLFLMGLLGVLMFRKAAKADDAFRVGQMRQLRFIALLVMLLGFLPTLVGNAVKVALAMRAGRSALAVMSFAVDPMCIIGGLFVFVAARMLVAGAVFAQQGPERAFAGVHRAEPATASAGSTGSLGSTDSLEPTSSYVAAKVPRVEETAATDPLADYAPTDES